MSPALNRPYSPFGHLPETEFAVLRNLLDYKVSHHPARRDFIREGGRTNDVRVVLSGWACQYKMLEDGRRQVLGYALPGDICDVDAVLLDRVSYSVNAVTSVQVASLSRHQINMLRSEYPLIGRALSWSVLATLAVQREWTVSLGQRTAIERIGHLFCELHLRLRAIGQADATGFDLPLRQADIADALGLTSVHVNRMLQELRMRGLIVLQSRRLTFLDLDALRRLSMFDPDYLCLDGVNERLAANAL